MKWWNLIKAQEPSHSYWCSQASCSIWKLLVCRMYKVQHCDGTFQNMFYFNSAQDSVSQCFFFLFSFFCNQLAGSGCCLGKRLNIFTSDPVFSLWLPYLAGKIPQFQSLQQQTVRQLHRMIQPTAPFLVGWVVHRF